MFIFGLDKITSYACFICILHIQTKHYLDLMVPTMNLANIMEHEIPLKLLQTKLSQN